MKDKRSKMKNPKDIKKGFTGLKNNKGFTLIELAIVLVIIGLILGAVLKGQDLINSAKQKNFYSSFIKAWELSIVSYYGRTGHLLGDGTMNGGTRTTHDGRFDNVSGDRFNAVGGIDATLQRVGLEVPESNTANSGEYMFRGAAGSSTIRMHLRLSPRGLFTTDGQHNYLRFNGMPTDLAIAVDRMVDGQIDPRKGKFRSHDTVLTTWPDVITTATVHTAYRIDL